MANGLFSVKLSIRWFTVVILAMLFYPNLEGQVTTAHLEGVVKDTTGGVVPGATIVAVNEATNISYEALTNDTGFYLFAKLTPGRYTVTSELAGFKRSVQTGIPLFIGDTATLNFVLEPGDITEQVIVTGRAPTVDRVSQSIGQVVTKEEIQQLPLIDRNPLTLFYQQAGANPRNRPSAGQRRQHGEGNVDGLRVTANNVTVEGITTQDPFLRFAPEFSVIPIPLEAVGEYRVVTSSAAAEYGRGGGAQVQLLYRSGTNELHGSLFNFHRNTVLNANNFFNNRQGNERPTFLRNQFGFALGGPLIKDKTFLFGTYEGVRQKRDEILNKRVYTQTMRTGVFRYYIPGRNSTSLVNLQGIPNVSPADIGTIDVFSVDPTRLGPDPSGIVASKLTQIPLPNNFDIGDGFNLGGYRFNSDIPFLQDQFVIKGDHQLTEKHRLTMSVGWYRDEQENAHLVSGFRSSVQDETHLSGTLALTSTFSSRFLNEFRLGAQERDGRTAPTHPDTFDRDGNFQLHGLGSGGGGGTNGNPQGVLLPIGTKDAVLNLADNVTWIHSNHAFKGGVDLRINRADSRGPGNFQIPVVSTINSGNPANIPSLEGLSPADRVLAQQMTNDLTGTIGSIRQDIIANTTDAFTPFEVRFRRWRSREYSFFFQDTWKMRPDLTVNLGLRWEILPPVWEANGVIAQPLGGSDSILGISGPTGAPTRTGLAPDKGRGLYEIDWNNLAPNIGFTWDPTGQGLWSVSANYRIAYDRQAMFTTNVADNLTQGMKDQREIFPGGRFSEASEHLPFPVPELFAPIPFERQGLLYLIDPGLHVPYTQSWSLRIQRELTRDMVLQVAYVGNKATGQYRALDLNQPDGRDNGFLESFLAAQRNLEANGNPNLGEDTGVFGKIFLPFRGIPPFLNPFIARGEMGLVANIIDTNLDPRFRLLERAGLPLTFFRSNPQFRSAGNLGNHSNSNWHGLKVELARRFHQGLQFHINYTLGKTLTDFVGSLDQFSPSRDPKNRKLEKRIGAFDSTHVLNANFIWEFPVGRGRRWLTDSDPVVAGLLGGWQVNGIVSYASGWPFTIYSGRNTLTYQLSSTPDYCCDWDIARVTKGDQIRILSEEDRVLFSNPPAGSPGTLAESRFRGDDVFTVDASLFKSLGLPFLGDQGELQLRFEFFNLFNNVDFNVCGGEQVGGFCQLRINDANFGVMSSARDARIIQVGARLSF